MVFGLKEPRQLGRGRGDVFRLFHSRVVVVWLLLFLMLQLDRKVSTSSLIVTLVPVVLVLAQINFKDTHREQPRGKPRFSLSTRSTGVKSHRCRRRRPPYGGEASGYGTQKESRVAESEHMSTSVQHHRHQHDNIINMVSTATTTT